VYNWSHKSDENKKKAIKFVHGLEKAINDNKELTKEDLDKISGGKIIYYDLD
jgi:bacteriocin-like protein